MMSRRSNVKVYSFSGPTTHDIKDFLNPLLSRKPSNLILHVGTNDLAYHDPQYIVNNIVNLTTKATQLGIKCALSNIIKRDSHTYILLDASFEIHADIFASLESIRRAFRRVKYRKTSKNISRYFKRRHLIIYLLSNSKNFTPGVKILEFKSNRRHQDFPKK